MELCPDLKGRGCTIVEGQERRIAHQLKRDWIATPPAFERLLSWLDDGVDSGGESYLEMRRRLVAYFERKRALHPDDLADETLNRVARRLEEQGGITDGPPARYCYIVAKFVLLEHLRDPATRKVQFLDDAGHDRGREAAAEASADADRERLHRCLDRCMQTLNRDDRALILDYYRGEQGDKIARRRKLAAAYKLTANALAIRACRIRDKLERCVSACGAERGHDRFWRVSSQ
jgi:hypothetical protein